MEWLLSMEGLIISSAIAACALTLFLSRRIEGPKAGCLTGVIMFAGAVIGALAIIYWPYEERQSSTLALVMIFLPLWVSIGSIVGILVAAPIKLIWLANRRKN